MPLEGLALLGLTFAFLGSVIILLPDIPYLQTVVMPTDEITEIQTAQQTLLADGELTDDDPGFAALHDIIPWDADAAGTPYKILIGDDRDRENTVVQARSKNPDADHVYATAYGGHPTQVSVIVDEHIRQLRQDIRRKFLIIGVGLLASGFALRVTVRAWRLL